MKQIAIAMLHLLFSCTMAYSYSSGLFDKKPASVQYPEHTTKARSVFIEYGGPSTHLSINFDTRFKEKRNGWGLRVGAGYLPNDSERQFSLPIQINYLLGRKRHLFETGAGATYFYTNIAGSYWGVNSNEGGSVFATLSAGYRYQPLKRGITARAGANALAGYFLPIIIPHVSIGYVF